MSALESQMMKTIMIYKIKKNSNTTMTT